MPSTFKQKDEEQARALRRLLATAHKRLREAGVTVELIAAFGAVDREGNLTTPAITDRERQVPGQCKITKLVHRVAGLPDVLILVDGDKWEEWTEEEQIAVVDHQLTHIEIVLDGIKPALDSHGRPKLKNRPHDHSHGWFDEVAERNGEHSQEVQQARRVVEECEQLYFAGMGVSDEAEAAVKRFKDSLGKAGASVKFRVQPKRPDA